MGLVIVENVVHGMATDGQAFVPAEQLTDLQTQLGQLKKQNDDLNSQVNDCQDQISNLKSENSNLQANNDDLQSFKKVALSSNGTAQTVSLLSPDGSTYTVTAHIIVDSAGDISIC